MVQQKLCLTCGRPFEAPWRSHRQYCSPQCWPSLNKHSRRAKPKSTVECAQCGKAFERDTWLVRRREREGQANYCSTACRDVARRAQRGTRRVEWIAKTCPICGADFEVPPREARRIYCSHSCAGKAGGRRARRGTRFVNGDGYVMIYVPPDERLPGQEQYAHQPEHRLVMARTLGRPLAKHESVHHINGDKTDNRPENLQLRSGQHGKGHVLRCRCCGSSDIEYVEL